jgi:hypothetical protein
MAVELNQVAAKTTASCQSASRDGGGTYATSDQRKSHLTEWTHMYNWHRPHGSLNSKPPISRLGLRKDNLLRFHIQSMSGSG